MAIIFTLDICKIIIETHNLFIKYMGQIFRFKQILKFISTQFISQNARVFKDLDQPYFTDEKN